MGKLQMSMGLLTVVLQHPLGKNTTIPPIREDWLIDSLPTAGIPDKKTPAESRGSFFISIYR